MLVDPESGIQLPGWLGWLSGLGAVVGQWFINRRNRARDAAESSAEISSYRADSTVTDAAAAQVKSLLERVDSLESKYTKLWDDLQTEKAAGSKLRERVRQLEGILRVNNITIPAETL